MKRGKDRKTDERERMGGNKIGRLPKKSWATMERGSRRADSNSS